MTKTAPGAQARSEEIAFDLPGGPDAALLLHGLTGSPFEMRYLGERLAAAGMRALGPWMAGHGDPAVLAATPHTEWIAQARHELRRLEGARRVLVAGCSMGALVACALAHQLPDRVDGLALLAPALELAPAGRLAGFLARHTPAARLFPFLPKRSGSDVRDPEARRRNPCMEVVPLASVGELQSLQEEVGRLLPAIAVPALVVAGAQDHTVTLAGARRLALRIGSGPARLVVLPESWHLVGIDVERERCADEVLDFFQTIPERRGR